MSGDYAPNRGSYVEQIQSLPGFDFPLVTPVCWLVNVKLCTIQTLPTQQATTGLLYHTRGEFNFIFPPRCCRSCWGCAEAQPIHDCMQLPCFHDEAGEQTSVFC